MTSHWQKGWEAACAGRTGSTDLVLVPSGQWWAADGWGPQAGGGGSCVSTGCDTTSPMICSTPTLVQELQLEVCAQCRSSAMTSRPRCWQAQPQSGLSSDLE